MSAIVKLGDVYKSFGSNQVLKGVSLEVAKGEMIAVIGASGSGKSTALRCIDRLETIDRGTIEVCGIRVDDPKVDLHQLRREVGIVFQSYNLFAHLSVEENIMLALRHVKKLGRDEARRVATRSASRRKLMPTRSSFQVDSSSVSRLRGRSRCHRRSCCSTK
jgi:polar amino acid transport system ATP-binding protein